VAQYPRQKSAYLAHEARLSLLDVTCARGFLAVCRLGRGRRRGSVGGRNTVGSLDGCTWGLLGDGNGRRGSFSWNDILLDGRRSSVVVLGGVGAVGRANILTSDIGSRGSVRGRAGQCWVLLGLLLCLLGVDGRVGSNGFGTGGIGCERCVDSSVLFRIPGRDGSDGGCGDRSVVLPGLVLGGQVVLGLVILGDRGQRAAGGIHLCMSVTVAENVGDCSLFGGSPPGRGMAVSSFLADASVAADVLATFNSWTFFSKSATAAEGGDCPTGEVASVGPSFWAMWSTSIPLARASSTVILVSVLFRHSREKYSLGHPESSGYR
jgi:hypothetical protein